MDVMGQAEPCRFPRFNKLLRSKILCSDGSERAERARPRGLDKVFGGFHQVRTYPLSHKIHFLMFLDRWWSRTDGLSQGAMDSLGIQVRVAGNGTT